MTIRSATFVESKLLVTNNTTNIAITILGMTINPGRTVDLFRAVEGLTESRVIAAMQGPHGELFSASSRGNITIREINLNIFENDPNVPIYGGEYTIYVDPVLGNDNNLGTISTLPVRTLAEARSRVSLVNVQCVIQLSTGQHALNDYVVAGTNNLQRNLFTSIHGLVVRGTNTLIQTVTVTGVVDNVMTVSDTLTVDGLIGKFIEWVSGPTTFRRWIIDNDANTITVAAAVSSFGGTTVLPTGAVSVYEIGTKIVQPPTNATNVANRLYFSGAVRFEFLDFDRTPNGGTQGPTQEDSGADVLFTACKWSGQWTTALVTGGICTVQLSMFDRGGSKGGTAMIAGGPNDLVFGEAVFKDWTTCIQSGTGLLTLGSPTMQWIINCDRFIEARGTNIEDFTGRLWVDGGLVQYILTSRNGCKYIKLTNALRGVTGHKSVTRVYESSEGAAVFNLFDSTLNDLDIATSYILAESIDITLQEYLDGYGGQNPRRYNDDMGNTFFF